MSKSEFFQKQSELTAAKIEIYKRYLEKYLPKLLMQFGECSFADLFCGAGKNGDNMGSPLILLNMAKYILSNPAISKKNINILFNDQNEDNIINLIDELKKIEFGDNIHIKCINEKFEDLLPQIIDKNRCNKIPKFIFLDPFTYSNVKIEHLKELMGLHHTEVLLFIPIFHSYRFASDESMREGHETRIFLEQFTTKGIADYKNVYDFMYSIKEKLLVELSLDYVRPVLLEGGVCKNSLFLLTKHQAGMLAMNKVAFQLSDDGSQIDVKTQDHLSLFPMEETSAKFSNFMAKLLEQMKSQKRMTNEEIVDFTIREEFLPKHGKEVLEDLFEKEMIKVYDSEGKEINSKREWNIAEKINKKRVFVWEG